MAEHGNPVSRASSSADLNWHSLTEINIMTCTIGEQRLFVRSDKPFLPQGEGGMQDAAGSDRDGSAGPSTGWSPEESSVFPQQICTNSSCSA